MVPTADGVEFYFSLTRYAPDYTIRKLDGDFWDQFPDDPVATAGAEA